MAQQAPHCAVCMIFQTYHQVSPPRPLCLPGTSARRKARFNGGDTAWERHVFLVSSAPSTCWKGFTRQIAMQQCGCSLENALGKS